MSADYTIKGNPTRKRLEKALPTWAFADPDESQPDYTEDEPQVPTHLIACDPDGNYVHLYRTGKFCYGAMTRFGKNDERPTIDALREFGFRIVDEWGEEL